MNGTAVWRRTVVARSDGAHPAPEVADALNLAEGDPPSRMTAASSCTGFTPTPPP